MKLTKIILLTFLVFSQVSHSADKLAHLRTSRKIVTVNTIQPPYYTIQIVALQLPPGNAGFFANIDNVREFVCTDGYVRYTIGQYQTFADAAQNLETYRQLGYSDVFVLNTRKISLRDSDYHPTSASGDFIPSAGVNYLVQLAAFRFPVYISHFEGIDKVMEFYMKDRIYRYCVGSFDGTIALQELEKIKRMGYPDAFLVPLEKYLQYQIE